MYVIAQHLVFLGFMKKVLLMATRGLRENSLNTLEIHRKI